MVQDWLLNLPVPLMALIIFAATYAATALVYFAVTKLAVNDRAKAFKALSPGMLPPLGIIFGLLVGFTAAQVWSDFEKAKVAVATEASALRSFVLLAARFPPEQASQLRTLVGEHIDEVVKEEWPAMAEQRKSYADLPAKLIDVLNGTLALTPADDGQRLAQREMVDELEKALDARRQRIILSQSSVSPVKWIGLILQGLCALIAIAMVHSDNRTTSTLGLTLFATGIAISVLLIGCYSTPFTGEISIGPGLLKQVISEGPHATDFNH